ncbi:hypothetical protein L484_027843 [Morus notabilis]|uniref:Uncharacterized protein n=1 Tax=Morus notabilis TaxID=981085 RepID=W9RD02_9ROSA|nr:hypothetical protein L484_027843 [Morus notabilis]
MEASSSSFCKLSFEVVRIIGVTVGVDLEEDLVGLLDDHTVGGVVFGADNVSDGDYIMEDENGDEAIEDGNPGIVEGLLNSGATR